MAERPKGTDLIIARDFNVDLERTGGWGRDEQIMAVVATEVLEDLAGHFPPQQQAWCKDQRT